MTYCCPVSSARICPSNNKPLCGKERMDQIMKYEIVTLGEKITVGISARTNNMSPDMGAIIHTREGQ